MRLKVNPANPSELWGTLDAREPHEHDHDFAADFSPRSRRASDFSRQARSRALRDRYHWNAAEAVAEIVATVNQQSS